MKVKPSIAFEDMRGKAGGVVASKNLSRLYIKNRITPRNPQSTAQMDLRASMTNGSRDWAKLTQSQRDAWNNVAKDWRGKRILGEAAKLSGVNCYMRIYQNMNVIGGTALDVPPVIPEFPTFEIEGVTFTAASGETPARLVISIPDLVDVEGKKIVVRATPGFSAGRQKLETSLRIVSVENAYTAGGLNIASAYTERLGAFPTAGQKAMFEVYLIDTATGVASLKQNFVLLFA